MTRGRRRFSIWMIAAAILPLAPAGPAMAEEAEENSVPVPLEFESPDPWLEGLSAAPTPEFDGAGPAGLAAGETPELPAGSVDTDSGDGGPVDAAEADHLWQSAFAGPGLDGNPFAAVVWDDGTGPALYVGGDFRTAGEHRVNGIARWNGREWTPLTGPSGTGLSGWTEVGITRVHALTVYQGDLIVGGDFTHAGETRVDHIARWDRDTWSPLQESGGSGLNAPVHTLTVHDGRLIAGGAFRFAGGDPSANWIAAWDEGGWSGLTGTTPSGLDANLSGSVRTLTVYNGDLIAAGGFLAIAHWNGLDWVDRVFAGGIARWDGDDWSTLTGDAGTGTDSFVYASAVSGGELFIGGSFAEAGGRPAHSVAQWDGDDWSGLDGSAGIGVDGVVYSLATLGDAMIAAGAFSQAGGTPANNVARWNGRSWSALEDTGGNGLGDTSVSVYALAEFDDALFVGGQFATAGGRLVNGAALWKGENWSAVGAASSGVVGSVSAATVYNGDLVVAGNVDQAGDTAVSNIARWDGERWLPLGSGTNGQVNALAVYGGRLIAGGVFTEAGGVAVERIAAWDGEWSPLGSGVDGSFRPKVHALTVYDGALIVGGDFGAAGGTPASNIARWDGEIWEALGSGVSGGVGEVLALTEYNGALVAGGRFNQAGGVTVNRIASWDGTTWSALTGPSGTGVGLMVNDLAVFGDELVVAGNFNQAGGLPAKHVASWDGSAWTPLNPGIDDFSVNALTVYNDAVIVGGAFRAVGGETMNGIAAWDGDTWSPLSGPLSTGVDGRASGSSVLMLEAFEEGPEPVAGNLLAGGSFLMSGGVANWGLAVYGPEQVAEPEIVLSADPYAYKERGRWYADLAWSGATTDEVDLYRDGTLVAGIPNSGEYTDALGKPKKGAVFLYKLCQSGSDICSNTVRVRVRPRQRPPDEVTVVTASLPRLNILETYEATLGAEGGTLPYTWSVTGLPDGLVVDESTGVISNDPESPAITSVGDASITVHVVDAAGATGTAELTLDIDGVASVASGGEHTCALTTQGTVYCWGGNSSGQLGTGAVSDPGTPVTLPVSVVDPADPSQPLRGISALAAGANHTCALTADTTVLCWGYNGGGQLGNGASGLEPVPTPVPVADPADPAQPLDQVTGLTAGNAHTCATTTHDRVWCWGDNFFGQLGNRSTVGSSLPVTVVDPADVSQPLFGLTQVEAGNLHTCARSDAGGVYCWGWNIGGQLGKGWPSPGPTTVPAAVVDPDDPSQPFSGVASISAGNIHTCAVTEAETAYCWGQNTYGQLGNGGEPGNIAVPSAVVDPSGDGSPLTGVATVAVGGLHGCATTVDATAVCWGLNDHGQLGDGGHENSSVPVVVAGPADADGAAARFEGVAELSLGGWRTCASTSDALAACWGGNASGQLGDGTTEDRALPAPVHPG